MTGLCWQREEAYKSNQFTTSALDGCG